MLTEAATTQEMITLPSDDPENHASESSANIEEEDTPHLHTEIVKYEAKKKPIGIGTKRPQRKDCHSCGKVIPLKDIDPETIKKARRLSVARSRYMGLTGGEYVKRK